MKPVLVVPPPPVKAMTLATAGSALDHTHQLFDRIVHHRKRRILRTLHSSDDGAGVLLREKSLGNFRR